MGDLSVIAETGYGAYFDFFMGRKNFSAGACTGYLGFSGVKEAEGEIRSMAVVPLCAAADYRIPLFAGLAARPVIRGGTGYVMTEFVKHDQINPSITEIYKKSGFNPMASGGLFLDLSIVEYRSYFSNISLFGGVEYASIFQNSGTMSFLGFSFGASASF
jgi:hypothetical protein